MALVFFSWVDYDGKNHDLLLDASPSRQHAIAAQVTEHPVEKGTPVTDNIRPLPRRITVDGFITNTPIAAPPVVKTLAGLGDLGSVSRASPNDVGGGAGVDAEQTRVTFYPATTNASFIRGPRPPFEAVALDFLEGFDRVRKSFVALVEAVTRGYLFYIATSLTDYSNMAATSMTVNETTHAAQALQFSIEFQELRIVSTQVVAVPPRIATKEHVGQKTPTPADGATDKKLESIIAAGFNPR